MLGWRRKLHEHLTFGTKRFLGTPRKCIDKIVNSGLEMGIYFGLGYSLIFPLLFKLCQKKKDNPVITVSMPGFPQHPYFKRISLWLKPVFPFISISSATICYILPMSFSHFTWIHQHTTWLVGIYVYLMEC